MKKLFLTYLVLSIQIFFLILPFSVPIFAGNMSHTMHQSQSQQGCVEHCLQVHVDMHYDDMLFSFRTTLQKVLLPFGFGLIDTLLILSGTIFFSLGLWVSPFYLRKIKNYHFGLLKKIIVSTT